MVSWESCFSWGLLIVSWYLRDCVFGVYMVIAPFFSSASIIAYPVRLRNAESGNNAGFLQ